MYEKFVQLLQMRGVTAYRVSKDTGIAQSTFSDWKNGRATPKVNKLITLARYFDVSVEYFLNENEVKT